LSLIKARLTPRKVLKLFRSKSKGVAGIKDKRLFSFVFMLTVNLTLTLLSYFEAQSKKSLAGKQKPSFIQKEL
jgi:hypothetical protein